MGTVGISYEELFGPRRETICIVGQELLVDKIVDAYTSSKSNRLIIFGGLMINFLGTYTGLQPADILALFDISKGVKNRAYAMKLQFIAAAMFDMFVREAKRDKLGPTIIDARFLAAQEIFEAAQTSFDDVQRNEQSHPIAIALRWFRCDLKR